MTKKNKVSLSDLYSSLIIPLTVMYFFPLLDLLVLKANQPYYSRN